MYWSLRASSRMTTWCILCIMVDSRDKVEYSLAQVCSTTEAGISGGPVKASQHLDQLSSVMVGAHAFLTAEGELSHGRICILWDLVQSPG